MNEYILHRAIFPIFSGGICASVTLTLPPSHIVVGLCNTRWIGVDKPKQVQVWIAFPFDCSTGEKMHFSQLMVPKQLE